MGEFFGSIYCFLFEDFFGIELANYLWGQATVNQETNMFIGIGLSMLGISLFVMILYYYIINHPRLCNWWGWLIFFAVNCVINFIVGWQWVLTDLYEGLMVTTDPQTQQQVALNIDESNCLCFGVTNMLISIVAFIIFSFMFKWWSTNVAKAPLC